MKFDAIASSEIKSTHSPSRRISHAAGLDDNIIPVSDTVYKDDAKLSIGRKSYLKRALDTGITESGNGYFSSLETIKTEEAKMMIGKALGLENDSDELKLIMGEALNQETVTRSSAAEMLYNIYLYKN